MDPELPFQLCLQYFLLASHQWRKVLISPSSLLVSFGPYSETSNSAAAVLQTDLMQASGL